MNEDPCKETMVRHKRKNMERPIFYLFAIGLLASSCGKGGQAAKVGYGGPHIRVQEMTVGGK